MLVFGGNTHNDTSMSHGAKCFSSDFMAYDIGHLIMIYLVLLDQEHPQDYVGMLADHQCHSRNTILVVLHA
ncbi:hypothetical protein AV530_017648 [Patagioenas fasciata monilis]|uniref:Uncharacterized protein n=1 Tax=Patagioenas fasciata monilis TaxID=372326 RepID=A0A1V4L1L7_PATFA|nr:hypothetical protein AV530_017648 [Patagioenas fasciata monilis]